MKFLITGSAGFIGYHVSKRLLVEGHYIIGLDNLNEYYDVSLKLARLNILKSYSDFVFYKCDLTDSVAIKDIFSREKIDRVIHLGAQPGVRYSLKDPMAYIKSNIIGYLNILEGSRLKEINHVVYASSSSVYGLNDKLPFSLVDSLNHPASLYGVTKITNELMAYTYSYLYHLPMTGLRLFTVYGPWGRPDMVLFKFTKSILSGDSINLYNYGRMKRAFTFIDDVVEVIIRIQDQIPRSCNYSKNFLGNNLIPCCIYNVAHTESVDLRTIVKILERALNITAKKNLLPMQPGDVLETSASELVNLYEVIGFNPETSVSYGIQKFIDWYCAYYQKF